MTTRQDIPAPQMHTSAELTHGKNLGFEVLTISSTSLALVTVPTGARSFVGVLEDYRSDHYGWNPCSSWADSDFERWRINGR